MTTPTDYRLALDQTGAGLEAMWILPDGIGARFTLVPGLTDEDMADHRWYLEEYLIFPGPGDHARARAFEERLGQFGEDLYRALFDKGRDVLSNLVAAPTPRILTLRSDDPKALALPWELLRDARSPLVFRDVVIRRQLTATVPTRAFAIPGLPLRILLIIARPADARALDARSSARPMLDAVQALGGLVRVDVCDPPTLAELERRLTDAADRGEPYHVVHFDGHGIYEPHRGVGALYFEKLDATKDLVEGRDLGDILARLDVPLVLLEACQTADVAGRLVFGSVAPALLRSGVGSVIAFSHAVLVTAARILVERFYQALCKGKSIGAALNEGRRALQSDRVRHVTRKGDLTLDDWHIAQLYQAGPDPVLVPAGAARVAEGTEPLQHGLAPDAGFGPPPLYGFHGRERELLALHRKLRDRRAVVVQGMGGMGKSTLTREAAHWWRRIGLRPDGAAFFSFASRQGVDRAVQAFVQYVEGDRFVQGSPEALRSRAVVYFRTRAVLWVWDNFESTLPQFQKGHDAGAVLFDDEERERLRKLFGELTSGRPEGWLVVTCRPDETGLPGIAEMELGGLAPGDALEMAREVLARKDIKVGSEGYEREAIEALLAAVDRHPLSIELVMAHIKKVRPAEAVKDLRNLVVEASQAVEEEKNRSLTASLRWSTDRLSEEARGVLPYLAWFEGGAFEVVIEELSGVGPVVWDRVRRELLVTALVRMESGAQYKRKPYCEFHPTLRLAAAPKAVPGHAKVEQRFVSIYTNLARAVYTALFGTKQMNGMMIMAREEENARSALTAAFAQRNAESAAHLVNAISLYLSRTGSVREQLRFATWAQGHAYAGAGWTKWDLEREQAWALALAKKTQAAMDLLTRQLGEIETAEDVGGQKALCLLHLGRVFVDAHQPQRALGPLTEAIGIFETNADQHNLSAALDYKAGALGSLGRFTEALQLIERALAISRHIRDIRSEAAGLRQMATLLRDQHRLSEAAQRYEEAFRAAQQAGDVGLEGSILQQLGTLLIMQRQPSAAVTRYKEALRRFQEVGNQVAEMMTADLLGTAEGDLGHHEAARAWYAEAERLARDLDNERQLAIVAHNLGYLLQRQALALPEHAREQRQHLLIEAAKSVSAALVLKQKIGAADQMASSYFQLGVIQRLLGSLDDAERNVQQALVWYESRDLPDVWKVYRNLEVIATARSRPAEAAVWRAKKEAKLADLQRLAHGNGPPRLRPDAGPAFLALCQALQASRTANQSLPPEAASAIAHLTTQPDPLGTAGRFLQCIAAGDLPPLPDGLPAELADMFAALLRAVR